MQVNEGALSLILYLFSFAHVENNVKFKYGEGNNWLAILCHVIIFCGFKCIKNVEIMFEKIAI